jgi:hypothetical protein
VNVFFVEKEKGKTEKRDNKEKGGFKRKRRRRENNLNK